jgi:hypothetical protein
LASIEEPPSGDKEKEHMKNRKLIVLLGMLALVFVSTVHAQALKTGRFACPGTDLIMRFLADGTIQGITNSRPNSVLATGRYIISGTRLTVTFNSQASGDWQVVAGKTYVYTIDDEETFSGSGELWVRIGN